MEENNSNNKEQKVIKKEFEKHIHLHGYQEIKDFFKDEYVGREEELEKFVNSLLEKGDNSSWGLVYHMEVDDVLYLTNRKVVEVIIHPN